MQTHTLGSPGLQTSALGFGAMVLVPGMYGEVDAAQGERVIRHALDRGVSMIDTSDFYGVDGANERLVGAAITGRRDEAVVATKFGYTTPEDPHATRLATNWDNELYANGAPGAGFRHDNPRFQGANLAANRDRFAPLQALAGELGISGAQLALAWLLSQSRPPADVAPIPGTRNPDHLDANLAGGAARAPTPGSAARHRGEDDERVALPHRGLEALQDPDVLVVEVHVHVAVELPVGPEELGLRRGVGGGELAQDGADVAPARGHLALAAHGGPQHGRDPHARHQPDAAQNAS